MLMKCILVVNVNYLGLLLLFYQAGQVAAAPPPREAVLKVTQEIEPQVHQKIEAFDKDGDVQHLRDAQKLASWASSTNRYRSQPEVGDPMIHLVLQVLERSYRARDHSYSTKRRSDIAMKVMPPILFPGAMAGMAPKDVKDPVARRAYEEAIAENNRKLAKWQRERELQKVIDECMDEVDLYVRQASWKPKGTERVVNIVTNTLSEAELKSAVLLLANKAAHH